jgi:hypothetical protein
VRTNWLRKVAIILVAVGLLTPAAAVAAPLGINLVANPSFEDSPGGPIFEWSGNLGAYAYSLNYTGAAPPGAGERYWFGGTPSPGSPDLVSASLPLIDLAENSVDIDDGRASYLLDAFFSNYLAQRDFGMVRATFVDGLGQSISEATIGSDAFTQGLAVGDNGRYPNAREWGVDFVEGPIPVGTRSVLITVEGHKETGVGTIIDGYIDLVDFQIFAIPIPEPNSLAMLAIGGAALGAWRFQRRRQSDAAQ